jgi:hypothetical protein
MTEQGSQQTANTDTDADRYPTLERTLSRLLHEKVLEGITIERLELTALANGEANYRFWTPRAEDPDGGHLPSI